MNIDYKKILFHPWIGNDYENGGIFKKRILVLGESHYCEDPKECKLCLPGLISKCNDFTKKIILDQMNGIGKRHAIYTKLFRVLCDMEDTLGNRQIFWNSISYYNFIQQSVSNSARVAPTDEMCEISNQGLFEVVKSLKPNYIIILGERLWSLLPGMAGTDWPIGPQINENGNTNRTYFFPDSDRKVLSIVIYHPSSSYFSYAYKAILSIFLNIKI